MDVDKNRFDSLSTLASYESITIKSSKVYGEKTWPCAGRFAAEPGLSNGTRKHGALQS